MFKEIKTTYINVEAVVENVPFGKEIGSNEQVVTHIDCEGESEKGFQHRIALRSFKLNNGHTIAVITF